MPNYKISNEARMDLARIYWFGAEEFGETQADRYFETLIQRFDDIAETPYAFQSIDHIQPGYRRCVCGADSIYYRVTGEIVEIMRILGRQDANEQLKP
jgi:toxin ParE1/3/4